MGQSLSNQLIIMGLQACASIYEATNQEVNDTPAYHNPAPAAGGDGTVYMLINALDYKQTANPLSCSIDGRNMEALARQCGITNVTAMYDDQCQKENVESTIQQIGAQCGEDDIFVYYYSGHGTNLKDQSGDEEDGQDEAFCFVDSAGQVNYNSCMSDDDFAELISDSFEEGVRIIVLTDCCHSGSICDFKRDGWNGREAISITGCLDSQTSGDIGRGGIFTHSMLCAIAELQDEEGNDYSTGKLYNKTVEKDDELFNSEQNITIMCAPGIKPGDIPWPLAPDGDYTAPLEKRGM